MLGGNFCGRSTVHSALKNQSVKIINLRLVVAWICEKSYRKNEVDDDADDVMYVPYPVNQLAFEKRRNKKCCECIKEDAEKEPEKRLTL